MLTFLYHYFYVVIFCYHYSINVLLFRTNFHAKVFLLYFFLIFLPPRFSFLKT
jgi:hypothetical protein